MSTATVPAKSDPKCHAFAIRAAFRCRRPVRSDTVVRVASMTSTNPITTNTYGCGLIGELPDCRRRIASTRDPHGGAREEHRLAQSGQMLRLAVAVGVLAIGRALGHPDGVQGQDGGHGIDAGVGRLGQDAEAAAGQPDDQLDHHQDDCGHQRDQRRAPRDRHARESIAAAVSFFRPEVQ